MKKFLAAMATATILTVSGMVSAATPFSDVPAGHWAYLGVASMADKGIIPPSADGKFYGDRNVTRSEMAHMAANLLLKISPKSTAEAEKFIRESSTPNGNKEVDRYEIALMLANIYNMAHKGNPPAVTKNYFSDVPQDHWAAKSVNLLASIKLMEGYGNGTFRGDNKMTRYEAATKLAKLYKILSA